MLEAAAAAGSALRCTAATGMNEVSSRSHAIVQLTLHAPYTAAPLSYVKKK